MLVTQIAFPDPPRFVGGADGVGVVLYGSSLAIIRGDVVNQVVDLGGDEPDYAWISDDSRYAVARSTTRGHLVTLDDGTWSSFEPTFPLRDVAFIGSQAFVTTGAQDWMGEFDFSTGVWSTIFAPSLGMISQVEVTGSGRIAAAFSSPFYLTFVPGDVVYGAIAVYDIVSGWEQPIDIVVEQ